MKADKAEFPLNDEVSELGLFGVFGSPSSFTPNVSVQSGMAKKEYVYFNTIAALTPSLNSFTRFLIYLRNASLHHCP